MESALNNPNPNLVYGLLPDFLGPVPAIAERHSPGLPAPAQRYPVACFKGFAIGALNGDSARYP